MLTELDKERMEDLMQGALEKRLLRNSPPERNEEIIAMILDKWENSAAEQHRLLIEACNRYGGCVPVKESEPHTHEDLKKFPKLAGLKHRFG